MIRKKFLNEVKDKFVHVDYMNERVDLVFFEGFIDFEIDKDTEEIYIEVASDTDFIRIPLTDVRKIYLKENEE